MFDDDIRMLVDAMKVVHAEINSKGYPGMLRIMSSSLKISESNPRVADKLARKIIKLINEQETRRFLNPQPNKMVNTIGKIAFLFMRSKVLV